MAVPLVCLLAFRVTSASLPHAGLLNFNDFVMTDGDLLTKIVS